MNKVHGVKIVYTINDFHGEELLGNSIVCRMMKALVSYSLNTVYCRRVSGSMER